jgi:hypothetical protein
MKTARIKSTNRASRIGGTTRLDGSLHEVGREERERDRHIDLSNAAFVAGSNLLDTVWLAIQIADMRKNQDCLLSGRRNCAPIDVKALER